MPGPSVRRTKRPAGLGASSKVLRNRSFGASPSARRGRLRTLITLLGRTTFAGLGRLAPRLRASSTGDEPCWAAAALRAGSEGRLMAPRAEAAATERSRLVGLLASSSMCRRGVVAKLRVFMGRAVRALRPRTRRAA